MRVLVVEDARPMAEALAKGLREQGYAVDVAMDGEAALLQAEINQYDAIVLDVMLPRHDGFAICRALRGRGVSVPILMLTARDAVEDRVAGLDSGADDYLTKPFAFKELLARLRALLRRHVEVRPPQLQLADLTMDIAGQEVMRGGRVIRLTAKEYALLEFLMLHAGEVVSRERISEHVWDEHFDPFSNLIEVYIQRLRKKIDEGEQVKLIHTRRGAGYLLRAQGKEESSG
jgi:DNA-binding response OmpR family regulator